MVTQLTLLSHHKMYDDPVPASTSVFDEVGDDTYSILRQFRRRIDLAVQSDNINAHRHALHERLLVLAGQIAISRGFDNANYDTEKQNVIEQIFAVLRTEKYGTEVMDAINRAIQEDRESMEKFLASMRKQ